MLDAAGDVWRRIPKTQRLTLTGMWLLKCQRPQVLGMEWADGIGRGAGKRRGRAAQEWALMARARWTRTSRGKRK
jgi:hypothetical protein